METGIKKIGAGVLIVMLIVCSVFFAFKYFTTSKQLQSLQAAENKIEFNKQVVDFTSVFIKKVLQADREVDFETRVSLEQKVRDLKDSDIISAWQKFVGSKTEAEAQNSVKNLLGILIDKIQK